MREKNPWGLFKIGLLNSTANPANLHLDWAELAVLFSRQILSDPQDIFLSFIFMSTLLFSFIFVNVKPLKPITPAFFPTSVARLA